MSKLHQIDQSATQLISCYPSLSEIDEYLSNVDQMNRKWKEVEDNEPPVSDLLHSDSSSSQPAT